MSLRSWPILPLTSSAFTGGSCEWPNFLSTAVKSSPLTLLLPLNHSVILEAEMMPECSPTYPEILDIPDRHVKLYIPVLPLLCEAGLPKCVVNEIGDLY